VGRAGQLCNLDKWDRMEQLDIDAVAVMSIMAEEHFDFFQCAEISSAGDHSAVCETGYFQRDVAVRPHVKLSRHM
jgi:hypothetical protein